MTDKTDYFYTKKINIRHIKVYQNDIPFFMHHLLLKKVTSGSITFVNNYGLKIVRYARMCPISEFHSFKLKQQA